MKAMEIIIKICSVVKKIFGGDGSTIVIIKGDNNLININKGTGED